MEAIDTNILVYYFRTDQEFHARADAFVTNLLESGRPVGIPYHCMIEFLAIVTNHRIFKNPATLDAALDELDALAECPTLLVLGHSAGFLTNLRKLCKGAHISGGRVYDAQIASICLQNHVQVFYSADRDFNRFPRLKVKNPLLD
ncbi:MAG: PIN domain-containing protein [Spirochaetes bacterium]|nr:PIN domain-containing protein [Spirochaetota bacterium]